ncbi:hypothetical protein [Gracilibacillus sp. YIM 98692]|uniref:hypothetical protein n=1 Tax=Gracilibacillus sp. YIM 98692 TaxID=2663532 RepID=UPI0013D361D1|nr:hypothetical protein [Gracilibacillus sp. YIM 98692]
MRGTGMFFYFVMVMLIGFFVFVPWLLFVVPLMGLRNFIILVLLLIAGFALEGIYRYYK